MSCTCADCAAKLGIKPPSLVPFGNGVSFRGGVGASAAGVTSPIPRAPTINEVNANRGLNKEARLAENRREAAVKDDEIQSLNPPFPYRVIAPDFEYFRVFGNPPTELVEG